MTAQHYDILVIGAGVAGLSAAYFLSQKAEVLVLERESQPAYHSSGRSAAMYIEGYENPVVADLTQAGKDFFTNPPQAFTQQSLLTYCGGLTVSGPAQEAKLQRYLDAWQPYCPELVEVSCEQACELVPILRKDWLTAAAYDPSWAAIDVHELLSIYQRGIKHAGGQIAANCEVLKISQENKRWLITTQNQTYSADIIINAAGAWAEHIADLAGVAAVGLQPMRRTAIIVPPPENCTGWPLVHTINEELYFKPESPGIMVSPQDETPSAAVDAAPEELDIAITVDRLLKVADIDVSKVMHQWAGLRSFLPDRKPGVGFDDTSKGFFWLAGQGGFGVQTSPGLGELVAEHILKNAPIDDAININRLRG